MVRSYQELGVWRKGVDLVKAVYALTRQFPDAERYSLCDQMQRAAVSIPANVAEGWAREGEREFLRFVTIAKGSLAELETMIIIAGELDYVRPDSARTTQDAAAEVGRMLTGLQKSLQNQLQHASR